MKNRFLLYGGAALLALFIAGCGGDDGKDGAQGPAGPAGPPGADAQATVKVSALSPEQWAALEITGVVTSVEIASPPVVKFKLTDANGNPVVGIGENVSNGSLQNIRFALAKLVPGPTYASGAKGPAHWVSYMVTSGTGTAVTLGRPNVDREGTLVDNGDGTYEYTFLRDIAQIKAQVDAATVPAGSDKADLGDLTYDPNLQHRLAIQISGSQAGGDTDLKAVNLIYDFVPATGAPIAKADLQKDVVNIDTCNTCHGRLAIHGEGRVDTKYCVTCHTTQRAYGRTKTTSPFPALVEKAVVDSTTGVTRYLYSRNTDVNSRSYHPTGTDPTYVGDGEVMGNFTTLIHKIHQGGDLTKQNYNYANLPFNLLQFSKLDGGQRMCTSCHDSNVASKADLAYSQPSREACGACHDNVNFATGANHLGGSQPDDAVCALCHRSDGIKVAHRTENITANNPTVDDGLVSFTYLIDSATVDPATNTLKIVFAIEQQTAPATTKSFATLPLSANFTGGPSFVLPFAVAQDGVASPADYNNIGSGNTNAQPLTVSLANLVAGTGGTLAASTAKQGYYEATIPNAFPVDAKMRTVALQGYWTQRWGDPASTADDKGRHAISVVRTVAGDTARRNVVDAAKCGNCHEWLELHGGNRVIGKETNIGLPTGQTYGELVCLACHGPNMTSSGHTMSDAEWTIKTAGGGAYTPPGSTTSVNLTAWSAAQLSIFGEWGVNTALTPNSALQLPVTSNNFKDMIHGIHAGGDRVAPWRDARYFRNNQTLLDFRRLEFPGILNNCETCHIGGTYNRTLAGSLVSNHFYRSDAFVATPTVDLARSSLPQINDQDTVITPFAAACTSCHDGSAAQSHMRLNGAVVNGNRTAALGAAESCAVCHGSGREYDAAVVHK